MSRMCTLSVMVFRILALVGAWSATAVVSAEPNAQTYQVGVAQVDITPSYPIRLNGFGGRRAESEGVTQRIWAKAMAIGSDDEGPLVLVAIDSLGIREPMVEEVASRLKSKAGISRDRIAVTFSHSHTTPKVTGACDTIFSSPIPPEHQAHIDRYTRELTDWIEEAALKSLADRKPAELYSSIGNVGFAQNRRTPGGPVDHDLPMLVAKSPSGDIRAIYVSYACHCVTLSHNKISGDWSGFAQEAVERQFDGAVCLVSIGCGSDANPSSGVTGDNVAAAAEQGGEIANEVKRLLAGPLRPIHGPLTAELNHVDLPLKPVPGREQFEALAAAGGPAGYNANFQLAKLHRGEALLASIDYPIQTWAFGDSLAMVFLGGEVCVDYSLRIKEELDPKRVWMNAYANDFCCYIPSERLVREGGYGGGAEVVYFALPSTLQPGLEETIVQDVHRQVPDRFHRQRDPQKTDGTRALPPQESRSRIQTPPGFQVDLVAAEPLVYDPVAIDWGYDGRLWVCEMHDYPLGLDGEFQPGGRIVVLSDTDDDRRYDERTLFADGLPFPTDVLAYGQGALVCAAPDLLYLQDTDGDGVADRTTKLFSGFATENYQARPNSLRYGLDNWWYGANGLLGGSIRGAAAGKEVNIQGRDFRFRPDTGEFEAVSGLTQYGRVRDDWGNWFGCDSGTLLRHYPLTERYTARNPHVAPPASGVYVPDYPESRQLFPLGELVTFSLSGPPGRPTSACGLEIYRDHLLGESYYSNSFTCEPVNQLVHRLVISEKGATFSARRAASEENSEFLASRDKWFRPVQVRTGPDGCLWIVDMYRYVIEHPRWIPEQTLAHLDVRAGDRQGRIYRVRPQNVGPRPIPNFSEMSRHELVVAIQSPNGYIRDRAQQLLIERGGQEQVRELMDLATKAPKAATRLSALCALAGLSALDEQVLLAALSDEHAAVCRHAVRLSEPLLERSPQIASALSELVNHPSKQVRLQVAYSLGESNGDHTAAALALLAYVNYDDPYLMSAVLSSFNSQNAQGTLRAMLSRGEPQSLPPAIADAVILLATKLGDAACRDDALALASRTDDGHRSASQWELLAGILEAEDDLATPRSPVVDEVIAAARDVIGQADQDERTTLAAMRVVANVVPKEAELAKVLSEMLTPQHSPEIQQAAVGLVAEMPAEIAGELLLAAWSANAPAARSQVLGVFFSRDDLLPHLLSGLDEGTVKTSQLDAVQRQRLLTHAELGIREAATRAFAGAINPDRKQVVQSYSEAAHVPGSAADGRTVFQKHCASCHRLENEGHAVGPDLAALTDRTPQSLLEAVMDPNRVIDQRYQTYLAVTDAGKTFSGILTAETATSITMLEQQGKEHTLLRNALDELANTNVSLMPEGLEKDLSATDVSNLLAYLAAQGIPAKRFAGNEPSVVEQRPDGSFWLTATDCEIYGPHVVFESPRKNIGYWHSTEDHVAWNVDTPAAGQFDVYLEASCADDSQGNTILIEGLDVDLRTVVAGTGGWDQFQVTHVGRAGMASGRNRIIIRAAGPTLDVALMDFRALYLVPAGVRNALQDFETSPVGDGADARIAELLKETAVGTPGEYQHIPAIWRIAIEAGRHNDDAELRRLLDLSVPLIDQPLYHWQAVVVGGGMINGLSQQGGWPRERMGQLMRSDENLSKRWQRLLVTSSAMADDESVPLGTRYDALRILGADRFEHAGGQIARYLQKDVHSELQMGAVSAMADIDHESAARALLDNLANLEPANRELAILGMMRSESRISTLLSALERGMVLRDALGPEHIEQLRRLDDPQLRSRADAVLKIGLRTSSPE